MKKFKSPLAILLALYLLLALPIAFIPDFDILFDEDPCLIPYNQYKFLTCKSMDVYIDGNLYTIPKGFETDLASIPRVLWSFVSPGFTGYIAPAILHDYLYSCGAVSSRRMADQILYDALLAENVSKYTAAKFYIAVRWFGWLSYKKNTNQCKRLNYDE